MMTDTEQDLYPSRQKPKPEWLDRRDPVVHGQAGQEPPVDRELIEQFVRDGFVVLEDVFSPEEVKALSREANALRERASQREANAISVRIELQADCFSGIWARAAQAKFDAIEPGDLEEAVNAARRIGDDTLQRTAGKVRN